MAGDWAKLKTAYGSAAGLDREIAKLASKNAEVRANAVMSVEGSVAHQGTLYSASAPALRALFGLLAKPKTPGRAAIAALAARIACGDGDKKSVGAVKAALAAHRGDVERLAVDADAGVRRAAVVMMPEALVETRLDAERDPTVRAALIPRLQARVLARLLGSEDVDERTAAAVVMARMGLVTAKTRAAVVALLAPFLDQPGPRDPSVEQALAAMKLERVVTRMLDRAVVVAGKKQPLHRHARAWFKAHRPAEKLVDAIAKQLSPLEVLEALDEIDLGVHQLPERMDDRVDLAGAWERQVGRIPPAQLEAWARAGLDAALQRPSRTQAAAHRLRVLVGLHPRSTLDARFDPLVPANWYDEIIHRRIPAERLERIVFDNLVARAAELGEPDRGWGIGFARPALDAARFLEHCPSRRLAELVLGLSALSGIGMDVEEEVERHQAAPVKRAFAAFKKREANVQSYVKMRKVMADWVEPALG